jgi:hypothetical protein
MAYLHVWGEEMKKCSCGNPVEAEHYSKCNSCWRICDSRFRDYIQKYLTDMNRIALFHDIIIAEPIEAAAHTYDPKYGPKLYWDYQNKRYVIMTPDRELIS